MGNTLVNVAAGALSASMSRSLLPGPAGFGLGVLAITFLLLVLGEITPKTVARYNNERWAVIAAPLLSPFTLLVSPVAGLLAKVSPRRDPAGHLNRDEIITLMGMARGEGVVGEEALVAGALLSLRDRRCPSVMVPRRDTRVMRAEWTLERMRHEARANPFMGYPLVEGPREEVRAVIHVRDLLGAGKVIERKPLFFPETGTLDEALRRLREERGAMGIVIDEHGDWSGIITQGDILAKAVFSSTMAALPPGVSRRRDGYLVPAGLPLDSLARILGEVPGSRWAESWGGLVEELSGKIPGPGESFRTGNLEFRVESSTDRRINHILVRRVIR